MGMKFPFAQKEASPRRGFERNGCACAAECSDPVSITISTIKEFSCNDSNAFLLSRSGNKMDILTRAERNYRRRVSILFNASQRYS